MKATDKKLLECLEIIGPKLPPEISIEHQPELWFALNLMTEINRARLAKIVAGEIIDEEGEKWLKKKGL